MQLLTDLAPLRSNPVFRRLWIGTTLSQIGGAMTTYAVTLQIWDTTRSTAATGAIGIVTLIPMLLVALPGGSVADAVDRRKVVLVMTACSAVVSGALFLQSLAGQRWLWLVYVLVAISSAIGAVNGPARRTFIRSLVAPDQLPAALALNRVSFQTPVPHRRSALSPRSTVCSGCRQSRPCAQADRSWPAAGKVWRISGRTACWPARSFPI
jgi:hypothetical protein